MKKQLPPFAAGMLTMALIGGLAVSALAATSSYSITVDPINVQVNGEVFQPKDAQGNAVPVFVYNGTTYAPLRALAEAYGLEVGYDPEANMATVGQSAPTNPTTPDTTASVSDYSDWTAEEEAAYQEFKGLWEVTLYEHDTVFDIYHYSATYIGANDYKAVLRDLGNHDDTFAASNTVPKHLNNFALRFANDYFDEQHGMVFGYIADNRYVGTCTFVRSMGSNQWDIFGEINLE